MEVNCRGCAGCCLDWRALLDDGADDATATESGGRRIGRSAPASGKCGRTPPARVPLGGSDNFVALTRSEVRTFLDRGGAAALTARFWAVEDEREGVDVGERRVAAVAGRPVFFVGLRKPPKPVAPFGREGPTWLPACVFLDPTTLQCRIHGSDRFPDDCARYPEHTLAHGAETECERVEAAFGGDRLLDDDHGGLEGALFGPQALGAKLFCHPRPEELDSLLDRLERDELTPADRAECLAVAAASSPGTVEISDQYYERAYDDAIESVARCSERTETGEADGVGGVNDDDAWVGPAIDAWNRRFAAHDGGDGNAPDPEVATSVEERRGAPGTPGWDALE